MLFRSQSLPFPLSYSRFSFDNLLEIVIFCGRFCIPRVNLWLSQLVCSAYTVFAKKVSLIGVIDALFREIPSSINKCRVALLFTYALRLPYYLGEERTDNFATQVRLNAASQLFLPIGILYFFENFVVLPYGVEFWIFRRHQQTNHRQRTPSSCSKGAPVYLSNRCPYGEFAHCVVFLLHE